MLTILLSFLQIVLVEPFFDCYQPMAKIAGAKTVFVPLRPVGLASGGYVNITRPLSMLNSAKGSKVHSL